MSDSTALRARDAWVELVELLAGYRPDRPLDVDLPVRLLRLFFAPLGADDADLIAGTLLALADTATHTVHDAVYYAETVEAAVLDVITAIQAAPPLTPSGDSPTTAAPGEGVTGVVGDSNAAPAAPYWDHMDGVMPVESESCSIHYREADHA